MKPLNFYGEKLKGPRALHTVDSQSSDNILEPLITSHNNLGGLTGQQL